MTTKGAKNAKGRRTFPNCSLQPFLVISQLRSEDMHPIEASLRKRREALVPERAVGQLGKTAERKGADPRRRFATGHLQAEACLLYTSDAADE